MADSSPPGRIPFEAISDAKSWALPMVDGKVANKEEQSKRKSQALKRKSEQAQRKTQPEPVESQDVELSEEPAVKPLTARELEEITQAAEQDGFEKGYNEGVEQGKAEGRKSGFSEGLKAGTEQAESEHGQWLKEQGTYLAAICENLLEPAKAQQEALADVVFDLAVGLAKELLAAELRADPAKIVPIIDQAIAALPAAEKNISLSLHPDDLEAYQRFAPFPSCADRANADASLERGSCRVKSEHSYVDYSVAARILEFKAALADAPESEPEPVPVIGRPKKVAQEVMAEARADDQGITDDADLENHSGQIQERLLEEDAATKQNGEVQQEKTPEKNGENNTDLEEPKVQNGVKEQESLDDASAKDMAGESENKKEPVAKVPPQKVPSDIDESSDD